MAGATASALPTSPGGTGSAAQAGAMGSSGGTTTGTVACSSCCAPQGRYLVYLFGGYGNAGLCPAAIDNSQPFIMYATTVATFNSPYTAAQFCVPTTQSWQFLGEENYFPAFVARSFSPRTGCSTVSPPATQTNDNSSFFTTIFWYPSTGTNSDLDLQIRACTCDSATSNEYLIFGDDYQFSSRVPLSITTVSCSPPVFSIAVNIYKINVLSYVFSPPIVGTAVVTLTF